MVDCSQVILSFMNKAPKPIGEVLSESINLENKHLKKYKKALERICMLHLLLKFYKRMMAQSYNTITKVDLLALFHVPEKVFFFLVDNFAVSKKVQGKLSFVCNKANL